MTTRRDGSRITTTAERDDVDNKISPGIGVQTSKNDDLPEKRIETVRPVEKPTGGPVNRYLLCSLVSQSARRIMFSGLHGHSSSVTTIGRRVLRSYLKASLDTDSPLTDAHFDLTRLGLLNKRIIEEELIGQAQQRVEDSRGRHTELKRTGTETETRIEQNELTKAIAHRDWLTSKMPDR
ncbi:MAG TPA: hypothetical protein VFC63_11005 [Blastocatellia bacterium]|nr:hypothetical protein [Blastocatellia bacterium]